MNDEEKMKELLDMNYRALTLLGYATSLIIDYRSYQMIHKLKSDPQIEWFIKALNNVLYLNKPFPEMPN